MASAPVTQNEVERLEALLRYDILDTPAEDGFDRITQLSAYICKTRSALVTLIDAERQWFKSRSAFDAVETPRAIAFCAYTILQNELLEVPDATSDPRFANNPLVTGPPHIRFYAGAPLITAAGHAVGTLAVIDYQPSRLDEDQKRALMALSEQVVAQLELRRHLAHEREQSAVAAEQNAERFELVTRATNDAVWDWDLRSNAVWWNQGIETLFGYRRAEIEPDATSRSGRVHPDDQPRVLDEVHHTIDHGGETWAGEYRFRRVDGTYADVFDRGFVIRDRAGQPIRMIGAMMDISERKRLEEQLRHAQKMDAIGQLSGGIAHDFNNLLTVIQCSAMLLSEPCGPDEVKERATDIMEASERAASLTRQLLQVSRQQVMKLTTIEVNAVVQNLLRMLQRIVGEDVLLRADYGTELPAVRGDVGMLEQVLLNLVVNGRDAMPRGGRLAIATHGRTLDEAEAKQHPGAVVGRCACMTVRDSGCGIAPDVLPHVFEPFFTTKAVDKGTGLGLATIYGIVKQHGGWIEVATELGEGTTFTVCLPAAEPADGATTRAAPAVASPLGGTETIMVVEDEDAVRLLVVNLLERHGYTVLQAASGDQALALWNRPHDVIDLLLTDLVMPGGMTGHELAERLRSERPELKVIYTSGYSGELPILAEPMVDGLNFLQKPYQPDKLARMVRDHLDRG